MISLCIGTLSEYRRRAQSSLNLRFAPSLPLAMRTGMTPLNIPRRVFRVAAVLLLLLGAADMAFPQICGEDSAPLFSQSESRAWTDGEKSHVPPREELPDDDCFCCCSHILSVDGTASIQVLAPSTDSPQFGADRITATPFDSPFRPPRLT